MERKDNLKKTDVKDIVTTFKINTANIEFKIRVMEKSLALGEKTKGSYFEFNQFSKSEPLTRSQLPEDKSSKLGNKFGFPKIKTGKEKNEKKESEVNKNQWSEYTISLQQKAKELAEKQTKLHFFEEPSTEEQLISSSNLIQSQIKSALYYIKIVKNFITQGTADSKDAFTSAFPHLEFEKIDRSSGSEIRNELDRIQKELEQLSERHAVIQNEVAKKYNLNIIQPSEGPQYNQTS